MKKLLLIAFFAVGAAFSASAQTSAAKAKKPAFKAKTATEEQAKKEAAKLARAQAIEAGKAVPAAADKTKLAAEKDPAKED